MRYSTAAGPHPSWSLVTTHGWPVAERLVPIDYIGRSVWLTALGIATIN